MSWRGFHSVWGIWLPPGWQQAERLLPQWRPGSRVLLAAQGWLLVFAHPVEVQVGDLPGMAVVGLGAGWSSHPDLHPQAGQLCLRWHGRDWAASLKDLKSLDLSELWDWKELEFSAALAPTVVPALPPVVCAAPEPVHSILPAVPPPAPEQERFLRRFQPEGQPSSNPLLGLFELFRSFFSSPENQRYINKMLDLFAQKNWEQALRHAIPIGDSGGSQLGQFLGQLKPRSSLDFTSPFQSGGAIGTGLQGLELLKAVYRKALEQLLQAGRIEEAAYVQGELLNDPAGACELLERHGKLLEAARLATLKGLPAPLQVRLWFMAGRIETALILARRYDVEAEALQMLSRKDPKLAEQFRAAWATDLADAGCLSRAIAVGWPVREQLEDYELWLARGLASGGAAALEVLILGLQDPGYCQRFQLIDRLQLEFKDYDLIGQPRRRALLERIAACCFEGPHPQLRLWAGETARRVMRQANSPVPLGTQRTMEFLVKLSGDPWLQADKPAALKESRAPLGAWSERVEEQGLTPVYDGLWLGDGRLLLALGQAGTVVLSRSGGYSQRFAQPAYHLVAGERPLLLGSGRLSRFEDGAVRFWCQASPEGWAESHDGYHWLVWSGLDLFSIDLTSREWRAIHSRRLRERLRQVHVTGSTASLDFASRVQTVRVPQLELTRDQELPVGPRLITPHGLEPVRVEGDVWYYRNQRLPLQGSRPSFRERSGYVLVETVTSEGIQLLIFPLAQSAQYFSLVLPQARRLSARLREGIVVVCDDLGRVLVADLRARTWLGRFFI